MCYLLVKALFNCGPIWFDLIQLHVCVLMPSGWNSGLKSPTIDLEKTMLCAFGEEKDFSILAASLTCEEDVKSLITRWKGTLKRQRVFQKSGFAWPARAATQNQQNPGKMQACVSLLFRFPLAELHLTPSMMHRTQKHKLYNISSFSSQDPSTFNNI